MNTTKIIVLGILFNLMLTMGAMGLDDTKTTTDLTTAFNKVFEPFTKDKGTQEQIDNMQYGGANDNGTEVDPWGWIKAPLSSIAGTANNLMEGIINIGLFALLFFSTVAGAMVKGATGLITNPDGLFILTIFNGLVGLITMIVNFTLLREVYNVLINRKWSD